jgi:hypothetical protein
MPEWSAEEIAAWARLHWPGGDPGPLSPEPLAPDGSARTFLRLVGGGESLVAMSNPQQPEENRAWLYFARHLGRLGLPVPRVLAWDLEAGLFLMEDLGRTSLQEAVRAVGDDAPAVRALYEPVLEMLARLQAHGAEELDTGVCFDGAELTPEFLRRREAGYFLEEYVCGACGLTPAELPAGLEAELEEISRRAGRARPRGLVHRDFQSRNIVHEGGRLGLVDFQGARLGPAQYDLASLLHDPYVDLPWVLRDRLRERYLQLRCTLGPFDREAFAEGWPWVSLSRLMQALGAYGFLTRRRGRGHFLPYFAPALRSLRRLLELPACRELSALRGLVRSLPQTPEVEPWPQ